MSLLMDALKRAEQAKREQGTDAAPPPGDGLQLESIETAPASAGATANSALPDLNSHLESVDADLKATAAEQASPSRATRRPSEGMDRALAQNVLAAGSAGTPEPTGSSTARIALIVGIGTLAAAGIGGYFYWQLQGIAQSGNRLGAGLATVSPRRAPPPAPITAPVATPITAPVAASDPVIAEAKVADPAPTPAVQPPVKTKTASRPDSPPRTARQTNDRPRNETESTRASTPRRAPGDALRVESQSRESLVMQGYNALQAGRFDEAKTAYTQALRADSRDVDALLGLAALATRDGDTELAGSYYDRVLRVDPRNAPAHAGMIALQGGGDPVQAESRLKSLLNQSQGDSLRVQNSDGNATSALNFALGNLYASQRRWPEAQQAYFNAHTADTGNPDALYNLAISLEHLNQPGLARTFYVKAIEANRQRPAAFDRKQVEQRLTALVP